mmetsp:Transcript_36400/g.79242  ORF Transcript_36400/g.79242 Transcript_36400/m.79242 type:complete len:680 (+) Transcript_36400:57-2096(+)
MSSTGGSYLPPTLYPAASTSTNTNTNTSTNTTSTGKMPSSSSPAAPPPPLVGNGSGSSDYQAVSRESLSSNGSSASAGAAAAAAAAAAAPTVGLNTGTSNDGGGGPGGEGAAAADGEQDSGMSLTELLYGTSSYHAVAKPVGLTMILAALATVYINDDATLAAGEEQLAQAYTVFSVGGEDQTAAQNASLSLLNALIICSAIGLMTFGIVLLYKYRCMKCLIGYMIFSSTMLLGFLGGVVFDTAVEVYRLTIDQFSFYFTIWNFAVVGTISIFYQRGIPTKVTQGYLIATSVILAWQLAHFNEWTAWALLIMLALYDLCAVLTPCGPLKLLVNEFQADDAPEMPGLLYEAGLPSEARRPGRSNGGGGNGGGSRRAPSSSSNGDERIGGRLRHSGGGYAMAERSGPSSAPKRSNGSSGVGEPILPSEDTPMVVSAAASGDTAVHMTSSGGGIGPAPSSRSDATSDFSPPSTGMIPLAIAKIYRLPFADPDSVPGAGGSTSSHGLLEGDEGASPNALLSREFTAEELRTDVEVIFPRNGGRITKEDGRDGSPRYVVKDRHGVVKRTLVLNDQGKIFEEVRRDGDDESEDGDGRNSIKLGLGDFIFYSVLVSKAAQYSFATFIACFLVILAGLGGTLVLLSVYHQALPALPISIFLGVGFYAATRWLIEPWIQDMLRTPFYV